MRLSLLEPEMAFMHVSSNRLNRLTPTDIGCAPMPQPQDALQVVPQPNEGSAVLQHCVCLTCICSDLVV